MKYLVFNFKNAGIVKYNPKASQDDIYYRIDVPDGTLYVNHVYNMLAVMFGDRPIKSFKNCNVNVYDLPIIDKIYEMVKDAYVAIDSFQSYEDTKGKTHSVSEMVLESRFCPTKNSWRRPIFNIMLDGKLKEIKSVVPSWNSLELFISNKNNFEILCNHIKRITNIENIKNYSVINLIERLNVHKDPELLNFLKDNKYTNLINIIYETTKAFTWHQIKWGHAPEYHRSFVTTSPMNMQRINGKIYVPIKDEEYTFDRLNIGTVFSTLLDGGMVELEEILDYWEPLNHNVNKVFCKES